MKTHSSSAQTAVKKRAPKRLATIAMALTLFWFLKGELIHGNNLSLIWLGTFCGIGLWVYVLAQAILKSTDCVIESEKYSALMSDLYRAREEASPEAYVSTLFAGAFGFYTQPTGREEEDE